MSGRDSLTSAVAAFTLSTCGRVAEREMPIVSPQLSSERGGVGSRERCGDLGAKLHVAVATTEPWPHRQQLLVASAMHHTQKHTWGPKPEVPVGAQHGQEHRNSTDPDAQQPAKPTWGPKPEVPVE